MWATIRATSRTAPPAASLVFGATIMAGAARAEPWPAPEPHGAEPSCLIIVYWDTNYGGESWRVDTDTPWAGDPWNDQISSFRCERPTPPAD